ncbi:MAG: hypothetical protein JSV03_02295 [Planctomycetota bacterium]|nr:MAG: hypothetical protein JSV03_02295 [Planctomycetota bacterium]
MATTPNGGQYLFERLEAKRSATLIQVSALVVATLCIVLAAVMQDPINEQRKDLQLVMQSDIYKELPPEYAWVSAAGGTFRGLAADVLWVRAEQLKQDGKYYESHQLAKWICLLQPRFPAVWQFQAWNMSYNISVGTHTPQERWQWVYNGIRLLRDEGIPNNERIVKLYHQLGWTFFHKVGDRADDFHRYYKRMLAATMETLLGSPPVTMDNQKSIDWFRPIAEAPHTLRELIESKSGVAELVETLDDLGIDLEAGTNPQNIYHPLEATFFHPYTNYLGEKDFAALRSKPLELSEKEEKLFEFFESAPNQDFDALLAYLRSKVLREQYKMNPQFMLDMTGKLGVEKPVPIEWRSPWAHSLYWTLYGTTRGRELKNIDEFDLINTDRILLFSLAELAKQGRYVFRINLDDPLQSYLILMPDIRYIEAMHKKYIELGKVYANEGEVVENTTSELLRPGHVNNLEQAIAALYLSGKKEKARYYFDYLTKYYKHLYTKETEKRYLLNLDEFVQNTQLKEMAGGIKDTIYLIYSTMESAYLALSRGVADEFDSSIRAAELFYKKYQKDHLDSREGRQTLPPFVQMRAWALYAFVTSNAYPLLDRSIVWDRELDDVKKQCYDVVGPVVKAQCEQVNIDVAKAFPEPPGMAQWRKTHPTPTSPEDIVKQYKEKQKAKAGK